MTRREVRVDQSFFDDLDHQLGQTRGPNGEPSVTDFLVIDLPTVVDKFATDFDELQQAYVGREDYRALVATGTLMASALIIGQLRPDNTIILLSIDLDPDWPASGSVRNFV